MEQIKYIVVDIDEKKVLTKERECFDFVGVDSEDFNTKEIKLFSKESTAIARMKKEIYIIGLRLGVERLDYKDPDYNKLNRERNKKVISMLKVVQVKVSISPL